MPTLSKTLLAAACTLSLAVAGSAAIAGTGKSSAARGNLVAAAMSSPDHKTLVAAVKAASLVDTLASGGPFTVFAPTDAAFERLPEGTVATLLKPENKAQLQQILTYHVVPGAVSAAKLVAAIQAGGGSAELTTVQGGRLTARIMDGKVMLTDARGGMATVTKADLMQSNGIIHVTDAVSLPQ